MHYRPGGLNRSPWSQARRSRRGGVLFIAIALALLVSVFGGDGKKNRSPTDASERAAFNDPAAFRFVAGSENQTLEPIVRDYCDSRDIVCTFKYMGSIDIKLMLESGEIPYDAVWPAHSRWIELGDKARVVRHAQTIVQSPVALGIEQPLAQELGLIGRPVKMADLVQLVKDGRLKFIASSATQSNSGFSNFIAMMTVLAGVDVLSPSDIDSAQARENLKTILGGVQRSSGSSGWLKDLYLQGRGAYRAMINYEAVLIETNQDLEKQGRPPLYAVYPVDGVAIADSPLGFVARRDVPADEATWREAFFLDLQKHLLSDRVQKQLSQLGRRPALGAPDDTSAFRAAWGIDPGRPLTAVRFPTAAVIERALALYQEELRRPSYTFLCLDYSGSMKGEGERQLEEAVLSLTNRAQASRYLVQATNQDVMIAVPFHHGVPERDLIEARGPVAIEGLGEKVQTFSPQGGTDIYRCLSFALKRLNEEPRWLQSHQVAIVVLTDGRSETDLRRRFERDYREIGHDIPIFSITFGAADDDQLKVIAEQTRARVFDGRGDLRAAFRQVRGYN